MINGSSVGHFTCSCSVKQIGSLLPILFGISKDFLSSYLSFLVAFRRVYRMLSTSGKCAPSHLVYVDDIFFYGSTYANVRNIIEAFLLYGQFSSQMVKWSKSFIFFRDAISNFKGLALVDSLGMKLDKVPFVYLGVPLFKGMPEISHLKSTLILADRNVD